MTFDQWRNRQEHSSSCWQSIGVSTAAIHICIGGRGRRLVGQRNHIRIDPLHRVVEVHNAGYEARPNLLALANGIAHIRTGTIEAGLANKNVSLVMNFPIRFLVLLRGAVQHLKLWDLRWRLIDWQGGPFPHPVEPRNTSQNRFRGRSR